MDILSNHHIVPAFVPVADAFAGGLTAEAVSLANYSQAALVIITGAVEDTGISNIVTIEACTAADGTGAVAMAFRWRKQSYTTSVDTWTALVDSAAAGYNFAVNNTGADNVWYAEVTADEVSAAVANADWVRAVVAETANKTITAGGIWILSGARYPASIPVGAIV